MRLITPFLVISALALVTGTAQAEEPQGITGADWDDSHMSSRHQPSYTQAADPTEKVTEISVESGKPGEARILPSSEYREWQTGPAVSASASRSRSKATHVSSDTPRGKRAPRRAAGGRGSSSRGSSSRR